MRCPKCEAVIGVFELRFISVFGRDIGISCCICGYWIQGFPETAHQSQKAA
jgi:hypothetical protein